MGLIPKFCNDVSLTTFYVLKNKSIGHSILIFATISLWYTCDVLMLNVGKKGVLVNSIKIYVT